MRKFAAICVLCAATGYLFLSGGNVATESAFVIVRVMLGAVLLDHRATSLRPVAVATLIVLVMRPETMSDGDREPNCCRMGEKCEDNKIRNSFDCLVTFAIDLGLMHFVQTLSAFCRSRIACHDIL